MKSILTSAILCTLILLSVQMLYGQKPSDWLNGFVAEVDESYFTRNRGQTTTGRVDQYGNYSAVTRNNNWTYTQTIIAIEDGEYVHIGRRIISYVWEKTPDLTNGSPIKYRIKKDILHFIDGKGRKMKARYLQTVSKAELSGTEARPVGLVPLITSAPPIIRWSQEDPSKCCEAALNKNDLLSLYRNKDFEFLISIDLYEFDSVRPAVVFSTAFTNHSDKGVEINPNSFRLDIRKPISGSLLPLSVETLQSRYATAEGRNLVSDLALKSTTLTKGQSSTGVIYFDAIGLTKPTSYVFVFTAGGVTYEVPFGEARK